MRLLGKAGFYLKDNLIIEKLTKVDTIVFDKTGTLTKADDAVVSFSGETLSKEYQDIIYTLTKHSAHPASIAICNSLDGVLIKVDRFEEIPAKGIIASIKGVNVTIGSEEFVTGSISNSEDTSTKVYVSLNNEILGHFTINNKYRKTFASVIISHAGEN